MPNPVTTAGVFSDRPIDIRVGMAREVLVLRPRTVDARRALSDMILHDTDELDVAINPLRIQDVFRKITEKNLRFEMERFR